MNTTYKHGGQCMNERRTSLSIGKVASSKIGNLAGNYNLTKQGLVSLLFCSKYNELEELVKEAKVREMAI